MVDLVSKDLITNSQFTLVLSHKYMTVFSGI